MLTVYKLDLDENVVFSWPGRVLVRTDSAIVIEAFFDRYERLDLGYTVFERGDRFVEYFYGDRWYSVFAVHGAGGFKGWYCNVNRPAQIDATTIYTVDLALDLWVWPNRTWRVLDEDEFEALALDAAERAAAVAALAELQALVRAGSEPFQTP